MNSSILKMIIKFQEIFEFYYKVYKILNDFFDHRFFFTAASAGRGDCQFLIYQVSFPR
jgi:hypothetical protein